MEKLSVMWKVVDCVESCRSGGDQWIGLKVVGWAESCCKVGVSEGNKMRDFWNFMKHRQPTTFHISPEKIMFFFKLYENQPTIDNKQHVFADARHNIKSTPPNCALGVARNTLGCPRSDPKIHFMTGS